jgi:uncharacterized membrane-anchored protein
MTDPSGLGFFIVTAAAQIGARRFRPFLYWTVIVATTTVGTTMAEGLLLTPGLAGMKLQAGGFMAMQASAPLKVFWQPG